MCSLIETGIECLNEYLIEGHISSENTNLLPLRTRNEIDVLDGAT